MKKFLKKNHYPICFLLFYCIIILVYHNAFKAYLIHDDIAEVTDFLTNKLTNYFFMGDERSYRPLFYIFQFHIPGVIGGVNPNLLHLFAIVFHVITTFLIYLLAGVIWGTDKYYRNISMALIFALNPIHTESVAWPSGTHAMISTMFLTSALLCRFKIKNFWISYVLLTAFTGLSLFSSEIGYFVLPIIFLIDIYNIKSFSEIGSFFLNFKNSFKYTGLLCSYIVYGAMKINYIGSLFGDWTVYNRIYPGYNYLSSIDNTAYGFSRILVPLFNIKWYSVTRNYILWLVIIALLSLLFRKIIYYRNELKRTFFIFIILIMTLPIHLNGQFPTATTCNGNCLSSGRMWYYTTLLFYFLIFDFICHENKLFSNLKNTLLKFVPSFCVIILFGAITISNNIYWANTGLLHKFVQKNVAKVFSKNHEYVFFKNIPKKLNHKKIIYYPFRLGFNRESMYYRYPVYPYNIPIFFCKDDDDCDISKTVSKENELDIGKVLEDFYKTI